MFSNVDAGWADFQLPGTYPYSLSYLTPVPFEWLDAAIHGLETLQPFCVKGYLEPGRMICTPSVIRELMSEAGITFRKEFGQNFLIRRDVVERIAEDYRQIDRGNDHLP